MRIFLTLLIAFPLVVSLIFTLDLVEALWVEGPKINILFVFAIMAGITGYLMILFKKCFTEWSRYDVPGLENTSPQERKCLGIQTLFITYLGLVISGIVFFDYDQMKGALGLLFLFMGLSMLWSSFTLRRVRDTQSELTYLGMDRAKYSKLKRMYFLLVVGLGVLTILSYHFIPQFRKISPWDTAGVFFFLLSTYMWLAGFDHKEKKPNSQPLKAR